MVSVGFQKPGPSGTGPGALDLKEQGMIRDSLWDPQISFFSKVVEIKVVEEDNIEWKPTETIHCYPPLQLLFQQLC